MFQIMRPNSDHVWEMKSADIRVFGWIYRPRKFIAVFGGLADDFKSQQGNAPKESYAEARKRVLWNRDRIALDHPLYAIGEYDALV